MNISEDDILLEYTRITENLGPITEGGFKTADLRSMYQLKDFINPKSILEIGFNAGGGSLAFLLCFKTNILSIDIRTNKKSEDTLIKEFGSRFKFIQMNSRDLENLDVETNYDLIYIDGKHSTEAVIMDINNSLKFNPEYILFDDWGLPPVNVAIKSHIDIKLKVIKIWEYPENPCSWCLTKPI